MKGNLTWFNLFKLSLLRRLCFMESSLKWSSLWLHFALWPLHYDITLFLKCHIWNWHKSTHGRNFYQIMENHLNRHTFVGFILSLIVLKMVENNSYGKFRRIIGKRDVEIDKETKENHKHLEKLCRELNSEKKSHKRNSTSSTNNEA